MVQRLSRGWSLPCPSVRPANRELVQDVFLYRELVPFTARDKEALSPEEEEVGEETALGPLGYSS